MRAGNERFCMARAWGVTVVPLRSLRGADPNRHHAHPPPGMDGQERRTGTQEEFSKREQSKREKREEGMGRDEKESVREKREEGGGVEQDRSG